MNPEKIILGGLIFGSLLNKNQSLAFLEQAYSLGIRDIDTGTLYGNGKSELYLSEYIKETGNKIKIHSKIGLEKVVRKDGTFGVKLSTLTPESIVNSVLNIYKKFNEEKIHRVSIHAFCNSVSVNSQVGALKYLIDNNIIENYGICNFNAEELSYWIDTCNNKKLPLPKSLDVHFNLFEQKALHKLFPILEFNNISAIPYRVFCRGLLAERYNHINKLPPNSRANYSWRVKRYITEDYLVYIKYLKELATQNETTVLALVLQWTLSFKSISQICLGISSTEQLKQIISTLNLIEQNDISIVKKINSLKLPNNIFELPETFFET